MTTVSMQGYELSKQLTLGVGIGIGIGLVLKRCFQQRKEQRMKVQESLERLIVEVKALRETLLLREGTKSKVQIDGDLRAASESEDDDQFEMALSETDQEFSSSLHEFPCKRHSLPREKIKELIKKIDPLLDGNDQDKEEAYSILRDKTKQFPTCSELLWRFSKAQYNLAVLRGAKGDAEGKKKYIVEGIEAAKESLALNDNVAAAHKWYAILLGMNIEHVATEDKIKMGYVYKDHIEKCIELDPTDPTPFSLLGRWCFEVYMMPWYIRQAASALFATPPSATIDEALGHFLKGEELKPGFWKMNTLFIGKCYYQKSDYKKAKEWLIKAKRLPVAKPEDEETQVEINALLGKL